jgi:hypothetical protein
VAALPRFVEAARARPVDLVVPGSSLDEVVAPYAAVTGPGTVTLESGDDRLVAAYDGNAVWLEVTTSGRTTQHRSRRHARPEAPVDEVGLALTGSHVTAFTRHGGRWVARGRVDLRHRLDTRDGAWLGRLTGDAPVAGRFGQLGLRDIRVASHADGTPYRLGDGRAVLTATSAGPGFFDTAHTSVWALDPATLTLEHLSDLFFRRPDAPGAYGDHATHLVRDGGRWLVATSTWGDFDRRRPGASVAVTLAETTADVLHGWHLLDTRPLPLPTDGLRSVGVWDPHLVRTDDGGWLVGFVSAPAFFTFHPALASGPSLDALSLRSAATERTATEGTTLLRIDEDWQVLASDGPDSPRRLRRRYPIFDLDLRETGTVDAPYPTNIPWPTLLPDGDSWLLVAFDGTRHGGPVPGYGTHGDVVFLRPETRTTV